MPRVACTALNSDRGPHLKMLSDAGFEIVLPPAGLSLWVEDNLIAALEDCEAIVAGSEPYTPRVLEALPKLRVIARWGVGFDAVHLPTADAQKIVVATTPGCNHHAVAEHAIALLMGVARGFPRLDQQVRAGRWMRVSTPRVMGKTIGLLGLGRIGQATATRAIGLGMKVLAYDPFPPKEFVAQHQIELADLDSVLSRSEYISLHLPCTAETRHIINAKTIARMKPGALLINTARGPLVNEVDLVAALESGHLGGAGLDVFEVEPLPVDSPLLKFDNVLVSGHVAGMDNESERDTATKAAQIIISLKHGEIGPKAACRTSNR
ncbi:MAG: phosphoglycerate dehydrogenase [Planctomycetales bacterium]